MTLFLTIAAAIAAGAFIVYAVIITLRWLKKRLGELMAKKNVKKVMAVELERLAAECPNQKDISALYDDNDMVLASFNGNGEIEDMDIVKNKAAYMDSELKEELGDEHIVVYEDRS